MYEGYSDAVRFIFRLEKEGGGGGREVDEDDDEGDLNGRTELN